MSNHIVALHDPLAHHLRLLPVQQKALAKLGLRTVEDLLYHFPVRYSSTEEVSMIAEADVGREVTLYGKIEHLKTSKAYIKKIPMAQGTLLDETGRIHIVWFNQPYIAKMIKEGSLVRVSGKISVRKDERYMSNPKTDTVDSIPIGVSNNIFGSSGSQALYPVYPESRGISSEWIYRAVLKLCKTGMLDSLVDPIPKHILEKYHLPSLSTALIWIHSPENERDALSARKRFAFEEIFFIQLQKQKERAEWKQTKTFQIDTPIHTVQDFIDSFPFTPTDAQKKAIGTILSDVHKDTPMARLLEGDVGSGKTAVAAASAFAVVQAHPKGHIHGRLQVAYMCPTEILASQLFESFITFFAHHPIPIGLITGSGAKKFPAKTKDKNGDTQWTPISKAQLKKWVGNGDIPILIGTHALIQKSVTFKNLALVIIDEQHRFGTGQRQKLVTKNDFTPHLLSMTATPIPRTLSLTLFGDLDLTLLDELPKGRLPTETKIVYEKDRAEAYTVMKRELSAGRQAYVICPRIESADPSDEKALQAKSVVEEASRLQKEVFQNWRLGILHGAMTPKEKDEVMKKFLEKKIDILVATSVVEVGVNVPNATVMFIEGAERFGLSQLHQLRGRIQRSSHQPYCFLYTESHSPKTRERLGALQKAKNGFELAEYDLAQRGSGELYSGKQWGVTDIGMEALKNIKMVEYAREEAKHMVESGALATNKIVSAELDRRKNTLHFE